MKRGWASITCMVLVIILGLGLIGLGATVGLSALGWLPHAASQQLRSEDYLATPPQPVAPAPVLTPAGDSTVNPDAVAAALATLPAVDFASLSYSVTDFSGRVLASQDADTGRIPASSWKIMTALTVMDALGDGHRFTTSVVQGDDSIILVGGGDPFLTNQTPAFDGQAQLGELADQVVAQLNAAGQSTVRLAYDDSLFSGPAWHESWLPEYSADVAPISALAVDPNGAMTDSSALQAANRFRQDLIDRGISVHVDVAFEAAQPGATSLGQIESAPLSRLVERVLATSNNFGAEVLARQASVASGGDGSFASAAQTIQNFLTTAGLWEAGMGAADGSGLSRGDLASSAALTRAVKLANDDPRFHAIITGLPVAGVNGTLTSRFNDADEAGGRGVVHAKTGTLSDVHSLTGFTQTTSGAVLYFSFIQNDAQDYWTSVDWLDQATAALSRI
ncbi:MAG: D-alanyl-D-alanine carboxypeptidase/D-alanyl-D-alanine-endopeptidase [Propionibacteriaceae bacterium]|jgi:D-alanyl-D-alanine carboxypeptidase/D-alanyl-D-alanine-endopeptidase (penicillin-binding protein 4)|nr:D-alanyl-D-alanine carboxypeptidase/D-alanyl-D-alanine-endopeptidase [Propionibacteriaceae bacterium]